MLEHDRIPDDLPDRQEPVSAPQTYAGQLAHDGALMTQVQAGDAAAFERLVKEHQQAVHAYLNARLARVTEAEELTQEVFVRCYLARARFDTSSLVKPFLLGIARNVLREHARGIRKRRELIWTELCLELEDCSTPEERAAESPYEDLLPHLTECMAGLGRTARQALDMHYLRKLRLAAISETLDRSVGAVKLLLFRARRSLKRCLDHKLRRGRHE